jgi:hypothetical protein
VPNDNARQVESVVRVVGGNACFLVDIITVILNQRHDDSLLLVA